MGAFTSQAFAQALKYSHTVVSRMRAINEATTNLTVNSAKMVIDIDATSRRGLDMNVMNVDGYTTVDMQTLLDPYLTRFQPARGIRFPDLTEEYIDCGFFYATKVEAGEQVNGAPTVDVQTFDRSCTLQDDMTTPVYLGPGTNVVTGAQTVIRTKDPKVQFRMGATAFTTPALVVNEDMDPWSEARRLVSTTGQDLFFDRDDWCSTQIRPSIATPDYVWFFDEANASDFWNVKRTTSTDVNYPNVVVVIGDNPSFPSVKGIAFDSDPKSPTYRYGRRKERVRTIHSEQVTSSAQAQEMAQYFLTRLLGPQDYVEFDCVPNPALDVGDTIMVTDTSSGLFQQRLIVTHIEIPMMGLDPMHVIARRSVMTDPLGQLVRP